MNYKGSCHCGKIKFTIEGELNKASDCNCSRKGFLLWFVEKAKFNMSISED